MSRSLHMDLTQISAAKLLHGLFPAIGKQMACLGPDPPSLRKTSNSAQAVVPCLSVSINHIASLACLLRQLSVDDTPSMLTRRAPPAWSHLTERHHCALASLHCTIHSAREMSPHNDFDSSDLLTSSSKTSNLALGLLVGLGRTVGEGSICNTGFSLYRSGG